MEIRKVVVSGGCGFLGQHITAALARAFPAASIDIIDLKANPYSLFDWSCYPRVTVHSGIDICGRGFLEPILEGTDLMVHAAGMVSFSLFHRARLYRVHENGTDAVFAACRAAGVSRIVHVSSVAALGFGKDRDDWVHEQSEFDWGIAEKRSKHYMLSKRQADRIARRYRSSGTDVRIAYPSLMYGPGDVSNSVHVIRGIQRGYIRFITPGGNAVTDVRDVANGIVRMCMDGHEREDYLFAAHNLTSEELFFELSRVLDVPPPSRRLPPSVGPALFHTFLLSERLARKPMVLSADSVDSAFRFRFFDATKARTRLDWSPRSFDQTLRDATTWLRTHDLIG